MHYISSEKEDDIHYPRDEFNHWRMFLASMELVSFSFSLSEFFNGLLKEDISIWNAARFATHGHVCDSYQPVCAITPTRHTHSILSTVTHTHQNYPTLSLSLCLVGKKREMRANSSDNEENQALVFASADGDESKVAELLSQGARVEIRVSHLFWLLFSLDRLRCVSCFWRKAKQILS